MIFKTKLLTSSMALVAMLICTSGVYSQVTLELDPTIGVGSNESIFISTSGFADVDALALTLVIGDGGTLLGGSTVDPDIVSIFGRGILEPGAVDSNPSVFAAVSTPQLNISSTSISGGAVPLDGLAIAEIFFDTSNLSPGDTFDVAFSAGAGTAPTLFFNAGAEVGTSFPDNFVVTVVGDSPAIPEPSSAVVLFALGSIGMMRRKRV